MSKIIAWCSLHKRQLLAALFWVATLICMICIFSMSAKDATQSTGMSGGLIRRIAPFLRGDFDSLSTLQQEEFIESLQNIVRKFAHITEFALLGALTYGSMYFTVAGKWKRPLFAFVLGGLYALSDEIHQIFVPGRAYQLSDVAIDCLGVAIGIALMAAAFWLIKVIIKAVKKRSTQK